MEITLTKTRNYNLLPFGKFILKWNTPKVVKPNQIPLNELQIYHDTAMPMDEKTDKEIVKLMKKSKTDILTDGSKYYTRVNNGLTQVYHPKFYQYKNSTSFKEAVDNCQWR